MLRARGSQTLDTHSCDKFRSVEVVAGSRIRLIHVYALRFPLAVCCCCPRVYSNYLCAFELQYIDQANDIHTVNDFVLRSCSAQ